MATLKLALDTRRAKKDGTFPLVFRIGAAGKSAYIQTGIYIPENQFDTSKNLIKDDEALNLQLMKLEASYRNRYYLYVLENKNNEDVNDLKNFLVNKLPDELTIQEFWSEHVDTLIKAGRNGGARVYKMSLDVLSKNTNLNIPFSRFTYKELILLESKLYTNGMSTNGIGVYFRSFRAICNKAIHLDLVGYEWYPFRKYKIKKEKTTPRVLSIGELRSYFNYTISPIHAHYKSWLIGKLIFLLRGINLIDLLLLTPSNIKADRIIYKRAKTGKIYSIKITDEVKHVLAQFNPNTTLLGVFTDLELSDKGRLVKLHEQKRKVINAHLSKLGEALSTSEPISTYVFRYSYANVAKQLGYSKDLIAEALGHEYGNSVTGIYLEQFDLSLIDEMNEKIIKFIQP
jgi:integrase/recombinase XerD